MTEVNSGAAWAGLFAHEISHILFDLNLNNQRFLKYGVDNYRYQSELNSYVNQVRILNQLYHTDEHKWDAENALKNLPTTKRFDEWELDKKNFDDWYNNVYRPHTEPELKSPQPFRIRIIDGQGQIEFLF